MYLTGDLASGLILECNETLCRRLGYAKDELIGQPSHMLYHADFSLEQRAAAAVKFHETGEFVDVERILRCKDGGSIPVSLNVRAVRDADGHIVAARAVWRDISARKQADLDVLLMRLGEVLRTSLDEAEILYAVCVEIAQHLQVAHCSFVEIDHANDRAVIHRDVHGAFPSAAGTHSVRSFGREIAEAASRGVTVVISDAASDPRTMEGYESSYRPLGVRSSLVVPLHRAGEWVAAVTISGPDPRVWQDRESKASPRSRATSPSGGSRTRSCGRGRPSSCSTSRSAT